MHIIVKSTGISIFMASAQVMQTSACQASLETKQSSVVRAQVGKGCCFQEKSQVGEIAEYSPRKVSSLSFSSVFRENQR